MKLFESYVAEQSIVEEIHAFVVEHNVDVGLLIDSFLEAAIAAEQDVDRRAELQELYSENVWQNIVSGAGSLARGVSNFAQGTANAWNRGYSGGQNHIQAIEQAYKVLKDAGLGQMFIQYFQQVANQISQQQGQQQGQGAAQADPQNKWQQGMNTMSAQKMASAPHGAAADDWL